MIAVQIASLKSRTASLQKAVESLLPQVDHLSVIFNGPGTDLPGSDKWKFHDIDRFKDAYVFVCDDDIIYPPDFIARMIEKIEQYERKAVVTVMGKLMKPRPIQSFYRDELACYKTFSDLYEDKPCEIPGTCGTGWHSSLIPGVNHHFFLGMNSDIWFGKYLKQHRVPAIVIAHRGEWLQNIFPLNPPGTYSVFDAHKENDAEMTAVVNSFL